MTRYPSLRIEGGLIGSDIIDQIADGEAPGQKPGDFGLKGQSLMDEIAAVWAEARKHWEAFQHRLENLPSDDPFATRTTRSQWIIPLLSLLGYDLTYMPRAAIVDGRSYAISHRAGTDESHPPVHIVSCLQSLDRRPESGRPRLSPHSLLQEYLNRTEHLWGIVTNGYTLRLLRDSQLISRLAYIEFDLRGMMEDERFSDFALLYRLVHRSRLPRTVEDAPDCWLERYYQMTIEQGGRVRERLRDGVEEALKTFANGFLSHPRNQALRDKVESGELSAQDFYRQLLRLIYKLLFLMVAEERNLITDNEVYLHHYSVSRLRRLAEVRSAYNDYEDLWQGFQTTLRLFEDERIGRELDIEPLNGGLFDPLSTSDLEGLSLTNRDFLEGIWYLSMYKEDERSPWRRINYAALDVEEFGSVYESLLDYQPSFLKKNGLLYFELTPGGLQRRSTGSYYTPRELVQELIKSALIPVIQEKLKGADTPEEKERRLLSIKVCDPACGSGHFLLAAARCLGRELARIRTGEEEPGTEPVRQAVRDVIAHCIYGVDLNPLAVELCKVALWIEGHCKGKPLTFLDHRIKCGNSLVGVLDPSVLKKGIPDEAFKPVSGDDRQVASMLKKRNREDRRLNTGLLFRVGDKIERDITSFAEDVLLLDELPDEDVKVIREKRELYEASRGAGSDWSYDLQACDLWTAPFFAELTGEKRDKIPTSEVLWSFLEDRRRMRGDVAGYAQGLAVEHRFFHWPLEFPDVFKEGGFDVVLCNPPWERIKLQEQEFFATRDPEIANAPNKAARQRLIRELPQRNPKLWEEYRTKEELEREGFELVGNRFVRGDEVWLPLYEAKMIWQFDHRFGTYEGVRSRSSTHLPTPSPDQHADPAFLVQPWYWVNKDEAEERLRGWPQRWLLGFRNIARSTDERTAIFSLLPRVGVGHSMPLMFMFSKEIPASLIPCLVANFTALVFDYCVRQKLGGINMTFNYLQQFPVLSPSTYTPQDLLFIVPRVLELIYTSWDIKPFADDVWREAGEELREAIRKQWEENAAVTGGHHWEPPGWAYEWPEIETDPSKGIPFPPFKWNEDRRALLRAELDAYYAKLYGLTEEELRYILDPADIFGEDYPGETFRVLKEKEIRELGEYRARRLILEAWRRILKV